MMMVIDWGAEELTTGAPDGAGAGADAPAGAPGFAWPPPSAVTGDPPPAGVGFWPDVFGVVVATETSSRTPPPAEADGVAPVGAVGAVVGAAGRVVAGAVVAGAVVGGAVVGVVVGRVVVGGAVVGGAVVGGAVVGGTVVGAAVVGGATVVAGLSLTRTTSTPFTTQGMQIFGLVVVTGGRVVVGRVVGSSGTVVPPTGMAAAEWVGRVHAARATNVVMATAAKRAWGFVERFMADPLSRAGPSGPAGYASSDAAISRSSSRNSQEFRSDSVPVCRTISRPDDPSSFRAAVRRSSGSWPARSVRPPSSSFTGGQPPGH